MRKQSLCGIASIFVVSGQAYATDEIIVEGTRLKTPISEATSSIDIITAEEIELKAYQFALDAIVSAPGVTANQNGSFGGLATVSIRGAATDQTLVLLDGVPLGDPTAVGGGYDFSLFDAADIERIEVLKGPHSTLWGSDAIGGVINIITKRAEDGVSGRIFAEGGSFKTYRGAASLAAAGDRGDFRLSASGITTDGISKADADDGNGEADGFEGLSFAGRGGINFGDIRLEGLARYQSGDTEIDGFPPPSFTLADSDDSSKTEQWTTAGRAIVPLFNGAFTNELFAGYTDIQRTGSFGGFETEDNGDRLILRYQGTATLAERHRIAFGAEREETEANNDDTSINSLFALAEIKPVEALTITGGVRYDDHSSFGDVTTFRAGASWALTDWISLRGSWGEGFKAPTIFQLTQTFGALPPNGDLQPETSDAFDIGTDLSFADGRFLFGAAYFNRDTENQIIFAPNFRYENLERTQAQGIETSLQVALTDAVRFDAGYAYIDAEDVTTGERQIRIPRHSGDATLSAQHGSLTGAVTVRYNGNETEGAFGNDVDDWIRVDLSGAWQFSESIELYARLENLFDADYQQISGFGTPGISAYGGVRLSF